MNIIEVKNVWKRFDITHKRRGTFKENFIGFLKRDMNKMETIWALKDVTFNVKSGECIGIVGENASGKTTLLKILAKVMNPTKGEVIVRGKIAPLLTLGVGFEQELTAKENVYLYGSIMGLTKRQIDDRYKNIVEFSELEHFMDTKLKNFSSGMYVRLGFATAINVDADIILVDEVLSVGDGAFQKKCLAVFKKFKKEGKTILFVSHSLDVIREYCDRVIFLHNGELKAIGDTEKVTELYERHLINKHLKVYNSDILRSMRAIKNSRPNIEDLKMFDHSRKESYIFETGNTFYLLFIPKNIPLDTIFTATIEGPSNIPDKAISKIVLVSKNLKRNVIRFKVESLPLKEGYYEVSIGSLTINNITAPHKFRFFVRAGKEPVVNNRIFVESPRKLYKEMIVFGDTAGNPIRDFENGKTLILFSNMNEAKSGFDRGTLFVGGKPTFHGIVEDVIEKYNSHIYESVKDKIGI